MKRLPPLFTSTALVWAIQVLSIQSPVYAADDTFKIDGGMTWPMLPNESVGELAAKFYPQNMAMQQRFIAKTLQLNKESLPQLDQKTRFLASTAILVPNLKSLASGTKAIKFRSKTAKHPSLRMTYNINETLETLPKALNDEYEQLVIRNEFLKTETAKLNERLIYLQNKLTSLRQVLEKILDFKKQNPQVSVQKETQPRSVNHEMTNAVKPQAAPEPIKPMQADKPALPTVEHKTVHQPLAAANAEATPTTLLPEGLSIQKWIIGLIGLLLAIFGIQYLLRKRQQRVIAFLTADSIMAKPIRIGQALDGIEIPDIEAELAAPFNTSTQVDEYKERSILEEAKLLIKSGAADEAIGHLKWAIRAQPKTAIGVWLYLLSQLRAQNHKEEFERYAFEMHQTFNVMTPLWSQHKPQEMVIAESLEEFTHVSKEITKSWPNAECKQYLQTLVSDNRSGERLGFSQEVIDEILFLIELQDARLQLDEFPVSI